MSKGNGGGMEYIFNLSTLGLVLRVNMKKENFVPEKITFVMR